MLSFSLSSFYFGFFRTFLPLTLTHSTYSLLLLAHCCCCCCWCRCSLFPFVQPKPTKTNQNHSNHLPTTLHHLSISHPSSLFPPSPSPLLLLAILALNFGYSSQTHRTLIPQRSRSLFCSFSPGNRLHLPATHAASLSVLV